jgi:lysyl-tRNA synthetase class 2
MEEEMPYVNSSAIKLINYNDAARELYVTFRETGKYAYRGVPRSTYEAFRSAPSKGQFFSHFIRDRYPFVRCD